VIKRISIKNYRNIKNIELNFSENENLIVWKNWQWKTSILEAIYFLSIWKAYRSSSWDEIMKFDEDFSLINWEFFSDNIQNLSIWFQKKPRKKIKFQIDNSEEKIIDFIWNFSAVYFSPDDLKIIKDWPSFRRNFLDSLLVKINKDFLYNLTHYWKILKQRNSILKKYKVNGGARESTLGYWESSKHNIIEILKIFDEKLVNYWVKIQLERQKILERISKKILFFYKEISKWDKVFKLEYLFWLEKNEEISEDNFLEKLNSRIDRDLILWYTSVWPHRDDISFFLDQKEMKDFASQWEIRTWILSLKYAEIEILKEEWKTITLLLDDVFSELDWERQKSLIELSKKYQTIITSVNYSGDMEDVKVFEIENGGLIDNLVS